MLPLARRALVVGSPANETNRRMLSAWPRLGIDVQLLSAKEARALYHEGDLVIGRLDVLTTLDGVEPGLFELLLLERSGADVVNGAEALLNCHDKWRTARVLEHAGLPHPGTTVLPPGGRAVVEPPLVVKPRFGSWGVDVERCQTMCELELALVRAAGKPWFGRHGALLQELIPSSGADLRIVVARGEVVGAIERVAQAHEWRTNTSLGAVRRPVDPPADACALAVAAATAIGADLVGVDVLPLADGGHTIIELNGAVDFNSEYGIDGRDALSEAAIALGLLERQVSQPTSAVERSRCLRATPLDRAASATAAATVDATRGSKTLGMT